MKKIKYLQTTNAYLTKLMGTLIIYIKDTT
jgi:hypothetical protein